MPLKLKLRRMKKYLFTIVLSVLAAQLMGQITIKGVISDGSGNGLEAASVYTEWVEGKQVKRVFTQTLKDGSFSLNTKQLPCKLAIEHPSYQNIQTTIKDSSFKLFTLLPSGKVTHIKPLILSSVRTLNPSASQVKVTSKEIAKQNSAVDLPLLLKYQPSITTTTDAGNGVGYSGIRVRGTDATRINVTLNGIPMNDAESQGVWWVNTPDLASGLNNIQITRGVGSSTNGGASFGGTVSLETIDPAQEVSRAEVAYGSFNSLRSTFSANTASMNGFSGGIRLSNVSSDGYVDRASSQLQSYQVNLAYETNQTKLRFIHIKGSEKTYQAWYGLPKEMLRTDRTYNAAGEYTNANGETRYYDNQTDNYGQSHYQFFVDHSILNESDLSIATSVGVHYTKGQGYYEEYKAGQMLQDYNLPNDTTDLVRQLLLQNDFMGAVYSVNINTPKLSWNIGGGAHTYFGNHFGKIIRADRGSNVDFNQRYYDSDATKDEWNNYVKVARNYMRGSHKYKIFADLQLRGVNYSGVGVDDNQAAINFDENFLFLNPKVGLSILGRNSQVSKSWDVFLGMANREPSRSDFLNQVETPKAERLINLEVGRSFLHRKWAFAANYYMMYYLNQLVLTGELNNVGAPLRENVGKSYRTGIELVGQYELSRKLEVGGNVTLSQNRLIDYKEDVINENFVFDTLIDRPNATLAYSPSIISGVSITYKIRRNLKVLIQNKFVGRQYLDNTGLKEKSLDPYNTTDLIITYQGNLRFITKKQTPYTFTAYLYNVTNSLYENNGWAYSLNDQGTYTSYSSVYPQAPFNVMVKLGIFF